MNWLSQHKPQYAVLPEKDPEWFGSCRYCAYYFARGHSRREMYKEMKKEQWGFKGIACSCKERDGSD